MKKIVSHPLMAKVYKVYKSCNNEEQLKVADEFARLIRKQMGKEYCTNRTQDIFIQSDISFYIEQIKQKAIEDKEKEKNYE